MDWAKHVRRIFARIGEDATYTPSGGSPSTVRGMFLDPYQSASLGDVAIVGGSDPTFAAMTADVPNAARGDTLVYGGTTYTVRNVEPSAPAGFSILQLRA